MPAFFRAVQLVTTKNFLPIAQTILSFDTLLAYCWPNRSVRIGATKFSRDTTGI
jgi:hypothetical protein